MALKITNYQGMHEFSRDYGIPNKIVTKKLQNSHLANKINNKTIASEDAIDKSLALKISESKNKYRYFYKESELKKLFANEIAKTEEEIQQAIYKYKNKIPLDVAIKNLREIAEKELGKNYITILKSELIVMISEMSSHSSKLNKNTAKQVDEYINEILSNPEFQKRGSQDLL